MKTAAICPQHVVTGGPDRESGRQQGAFRRALGLPVRYWLRLGERLFHYQLLRAQMIERAFMPDDRSGDA